MSKVIYVKTTDTCNLNCQHCFTSGRNGGKAKWDWEKTQNWVQDFLLQHPDEHVHLELHGGEPFLVSLDTLESFVAPFRDDERVSIGATTNLVYKLTERHVAFIKDVMESRIGTSWDGGIRFENENQKQLWLKNVKRLRDEGVTIKLFVSVTSELVATPIDDFLSLMGEVAPHEIALERLTSNGNATQHDAIFPDNEQQDNWYLNLFKRYKSGTYNFEINTLDIIETRLQANLVKADTNCRNCEQNLVTINADGGLSGCPNAAMTNVYGNVDQSVETYLTSEGRISEIGKELDFHPNCLQCDVFDVCGGDCHRLSWQGNRCGGLKNLLRYLKYGEAPTSRIPALNLA